MFARVTTVAFEGIEARGVDVQVQIGPGLPAFTIVGLADKAVAESRERVHGAPERETHVAPAVTGIVDEALQHGDDGRLAR